MLIFKEPFGYPNHSIDKCRVRLEGHGAGETKSVNGVQANSVV